MADQTPVKADKTKSNSNGSPEARVVGGIAEFGNDIATLVELQAKLTMLDLKDCLAKVLVPSALIVVGLASILGAMPVVLLGAADLLAAALKIRDGWAMLLTGAFAVIVATVVVFISARKIGPSLSSFQRSREELNRNLAWIRTVLVHSGRNLPRRIR